MSHYPLLSVSTAMHSIVTGTESSELSHTCTLQQHWSSCWIIVYETKMDVLFILNIHQISREQSVECRTPHFQVYYSLLFYY